MSLPAALAASNRASPNPRQRMLWALDRAAWLQARLTGAVHLALTFSRWHDVVCIASLAVQPLAPERVAVLAGRRLINVPPLTARLIHALSRLGFLHMKRRETRRRRTAGQDLAAVRLATSTHARIASAVASLQPGAADGSHSSRAGALAAAPRKNWELLTYRDGKRPGDGFADGRSITSFPSGEVAVSSRFVRFCMLHDGGDMLAAAFAQEAAGVAAQHEAEELLLRGIVCPAADTLLCFGGLREPGCLETGADGSARVRGAGSCTVIVAAALATHWAQNLLWGAFRGACAAEAAVVAPAIAAAAGYREDGLVHLEEALEAANDGIMMRHRRQGKQSNAAAAKMHQDQQPGIAFLPGSWAAVVLTHPALGGCRKEALAAVALGQWLLRR